MSVAIASGEDYWRIREDAETLKRVSEIKSDPARLSKAQNFLKQEIDTAEKALGKNPISKHNNPATVGRFNFR